MTNEDRELESWRKEWQAHGGQAGFAEELAARVRRDGRRMRRAAALEVLNATLAVGVCVWLVVRTHASPEVVSITAIILVYAGAWLMRWFVAREGVFGRAGEGLDAFVDLTRRRLEAEVRFARFARLATWAIVAVAIPWGCWVLVSRFETCRLHPWRGVVGFGAALAVCGGLVVYYAHKWKRALAEQERFEALVARRTAA